MITCLKRICTMQHYTVLYNLFEKKLWRNIGYHMLPFVMLMKTSFSNKHVPWKTRTKKKHG